MIKVLTPSEALSDRKRLEIRSVLLRSIRRWVAESQTSLQVSERDIAFWSEFGTPEAAHYLDGLMWALTRGRTRSIRINCGFAGPSDDETTLLHMILHASQTGFGSTAALLSDMATPGAAAAMHESAWRLRQVFDGSAAPGEPAQAPASTRLH